MSVYFITSKTTLLSWRIISSDDPDTTFRALFRERLTPTICHECELEKVYVVSQVTAVFGSLIKYTVKTVQDSIKKCGIKNCNINFVNHLSFTKKFSKLHMLPDPVPGEDERYLPFENMYGTPATEVHRPSSSKRSKKQKTLPFVASIQHARNVNLMFQCEECGMLRLIYSKKKIDITS